MFRSSLRLAAIALIGLSLTIAACRSGRDGAEAAQHAQAKKASLQSGEITKQYRLAAERIVRAALADNDAYKNLGFLCLSLGHRLSGSPGLEDAIDWAAGVMGNAGADNVRKEPVKVPHWVRGEESVTMLYPREEPMFMLGLGGSVGTPPEGVTGEVMVVADEEDLRARADEARGKIVLFNNPMPPYTEEKGSGYGTCVKYRVHGARLAAEHGAKAALVRSVTAKSLRSPHTGAMRYGDSPLMIPAAAITIEDAETIVGLTRRGTPVTVNLKMSAQQMPDALSHNVIGELRGRERPEEVVVIGGHIDAWDVGHGAHDDGGGCIIAMEAINVLRKLNMIPRRTIRVVLWTNEENGLAGGREYARAHEHEKDMHVAAIESDSGVFAPRGYSVDCADEEKEARTREQMEQILEAIPSSLVPNLKATIGGSGADISPMREWGYPLMGHRVEGSIYFDYHHTHADTFDKVDKTELDQNVAVLAAVSYILADMPERLGE